MYSTRARAVPELPDEQHVTDRSRLFNFVYSGTLRLLMLSHAQHYLSSNKWSVRSLRGFRKPPALPSARRFSGAYVRRWVAVRLRRREPCEQAFAVLPSGVSKTSTSSRCLKWASA